MTLQARLTLWSVLVMAVVVGLVSGLDLANDMHHQFEATLDRAELLKSVSGKVVTGALDKNRTLPLREALLDPRITYDLVDVLASSRTLLEIAVCDKHNEILADSEPTRRGMVFPPYPDFRPVVRDTGFIAKLKILSGNQYYQLTQALGSGGEVVLNVRVVVYPRLIRDEIMPSMVKSAVTALVSVLGAVIIMLVFSSVAFRPLGQLGHMLDLVARGEFQDPPPPPKSQQDEFGVMASKVNLLGQQLRGAQFEYSDLRGNFERLLDDLEDAVLIFGRGSKLVIASGAVEKFLGKLRSDLLGQGLMDIFPPGTTLGLILAQAVQTGRPIRNRRVPITRPGDPGPGVMIALLSVDFLETISAAPGAGQTSGLMIRLRDPEATRQIGRQLQTADRLSAISRITGGVAHEVKNPLNAILMHIELARMKLAKGDYDLVPQMEIISSEILRLDRVVKTFLDFTKPVELKVSEVPLDKFLTDIVDFARPQANTCGISIQVITGSDGAAVRIDPDLMKQAVINVVVNAMEAMPDGGELRFESALHGDDAEIRISDTGPGIPPHVREKIFNLYFTTKKEGSGIGLAMTFRIVQLHDGTIDFSSEPGQGTTFVLRLPVAM